MNPHMPVFIVGEIDSKLTEFALGGLRDSKEKEVWIVSAGGNLRYALAIHDAMRLRKDVKVVGSGFVESAAILVLLGSDRRAATPNTTFMVHKVEIDTDEPTEAEKAEVEQANETVQRLLIKHTMLTDKQATELLESGRTFGVAEALRMGIIHEVIS